MPVNVNVNVRHRRGGGDSANSQVLGAVLVLGGIGWFLQQTGLLHLSLTTTLSCLLITLGVGLVLTARRSGGAGLVMLGIALTVVLASVSAVDASLLQRGAGERTFAPATASALEERYQLGMGSLTLDLTDVPADELAGKRIDVQVGVGELVVLLPARSEVGVDVRAAVRAGEVDLPDRDGTDDGTNLVDRVRDTPADGAALLVLDLDMGLGTVQVVRPRRVNATEVRPSRVLAGVVFTLTGVGFLLEGLEIWRVDLVYLWPVLLIAIGVSFLLGKARTKRIEEDRTATLAVAEERVRIARELHDIVAHGVSLMTIQIAAARRVATTKPDSADQALAAAEQAGRQSLAELRSLLAVLRSADASLGAAAGSRGEWQTGATPSLNGNDETAPTAPLPRLSDIPGLVDNLRAAGLDVSLEVTGVVPEHVPPGVELASYRVVQESLTNVVRHAPGARVVVDLDYAPDGIDIVVDDDGAGLMPVRSAPSGHGLMGMRERVATGGGTLEVGPCSSGPGWRVHARFPMRAVRTNA